MKSVLASLKPYYYYLVGEGIKKIEVRKSQPKADDWNKETYFYMSKDEKSFAMIPKEFQEKYRKHFGKVGLRFVCDRIEKFEEHIEQGGLYYTLDNDFNEKAQLDNWELHDYGKGKPLYAWHISDLVIYDEPKELSEFKTFCKSYYEGDNCDDCKYFIDCRGYEYDESDCACNGLKPIERPPQSWQFVEEKEKENGTN